MQAAAHHVRAETEMIFMRKLARIGALALLYALLLGAVLWSVLAVYYGDLPQFWRIPAAAAAGALLLGSLMLRGQRMRLTVFGLVFSLILVWWFALEPSNTRDWQPDVAILPRAEINGDLITLRNIRNCEYSSETRYGVNHYDKTVRLSQLKAVDLFLVYWGSPLIAHTMLSFQFGDDDFVCVSIETRKTVDEEYSALRGFFRQYELIYVLGDERDLVRLRTNFRNEDVYLYRLAFNQDVACPVFLQYLKKINELYENPQWYNALFSNCTTNIRAHALTYTRDARIDWRILVNGFVDEMAYERGMLDTRVPFADLRRLSLINARAKALGDDPDFSLRIREGLLAPGSSNSF
jgi:hypothetical protein